MKDELQFSVFAGISFLHTDHCLSQLSGFLVSYSCYRA